MPLRFSSSILTTTAEAGYVAPDFVSSGLTAYYDPANPLSYSGSGGTITDLSGNGIDGTIVGATHTDSTYFTLDGVNDYIVTGNCYSAISAAEMASSSSSGTSRTSSS